MFASNTSQASDATFIEDVFSTYLYTGTSATQSITNGIDLSGKGGLVWIKERNGSSFGHGLFDTQRGATNYIKSESTNGSSSGATTLTSFNANGFTVAQSGLTGTAGTNYASWTFRKQPKFFDVVTYTGDGVAGRTVAHSLGSVPGCVIVKCTSTTADWFVYHRGTNGGTNPEQYFTNLNLTSAQTASSAAWNNTAPTSTSFTLGSGVGVNGSGRTYVAYLFAHDAGGFGLTGTDNVISCGSFTATGNDNITLGYEPQWVMAKRYDGVGNWVLFDTMRGMPVSANTYYLYANTSNAEVNTAAQGITPTATGFNNQWFGAGSYIYIAIRRGPMKTPTSGTSVFSPKAYAGTSSAQTQTTNFPVDLMIDTVRSGGARFVMDRLRGDQEIETQSTAAESQLSNIGFDSNTGLKFNGTQINSSGNNYILWAFGRAPGFFDEVCYTGTGTNTTQKHNLKVAPELMIIKERSGVANWVVYSSAIWGTGVGGTSGYDLLLLNTTGKAQNWNGVLNNTAPTATDIYLGAFGSPTNGSGSTYVAYLFASCPGVSKVGSYTGTGATQTINCGFTGGARFVLIKRADSTGDWYVWDSARGIVAGNDPYLLLNSTAAEVTNTDYVDTYSAGFEISSTAPAAINASGGSFIYLAIA